MNIFSLPVTDFRRPFHSTHSQNTSSGPSALILAPYFTPNPSIGGRRFEAVARRMVERGWSVTVVAPRDDRIQLSNQAWGNPRIDEVISIDCLMSPAAVNRTLFGPLRLGLNTHDHFAAKSGAIHAVGRYGLEKAIVAYLSFLKAANIPDQFALWSRQASSRIRQLLHDRSFDVIYASVPPVSPVIVACEIAARTNARIVIDYRDPWIDPVLERRLVRISPRILAALRAQEMECLSRADLISAVSPAIASDLLAKASGPVVCAPHGVPDSPTTEESGQEQDSESFSFPYLFYAGNLYYGRSLSTVLRVLKGFRSEGGEYVRLVYCGPSVALAKAEAEAVHASEHLVTRASISPSRVTAVSRRALANLLLVASGYEYSYPGKLWEQIAAARPIVCLSASSGASAQLIRERHLGFVHAADDESGLKESVRILMSGVITSDADVCRDLSRTRIIDGLLDNVAALFD